MGQAAESRGWLRVFAFRRLAQLACMRQRAFSSGGGARLASCSTTCNPLYFETDRGDGCREPGFSRERHPYLHGPA